MKRFDFAYLFLALCLLMLLHTSIPHKDVHNECSKNNVINTTNNEHHETEHLHNIQSHNQTQHSAFYLNKKQLNNEHKTGTSFLHFLVILVAIFVHILLRSNAVFRAVIADFPIKIPLAYSASSPSNAPPFL